MTHPVKHFMSHWTGAPRCSGTPGDLIALLDACLINGLNLLTVPSLAVSGGVATATYATTHGYLAGQVLLIAGAAPAGLNGEHLISAVTTTTLTFSDFTGVADGPASGSISSRIAPLGGWSKPFAAAQKAVYRSDDVQGARLCLRLDDTGGLSALARGYEAMTDADSGTGPFPTPAQMANYFWRKSDAEDTTPRTWSLIGDGRLFYLLIASNASLLACEGFWFGDLVSYKAADAYPCGIGGDITAAGGGYLGVYNYFSRVDTQEGAFLARAHTQTGGAQAISKRGSGLQTQAGVDGITYPNPADNGLLLHRPLLAVEGGTTVRGEFPGLLQPVQNLPLAHGDIVTDIEQLPGRRVLMLATAGYSVAARLAFDITGPWR